MKRRNFPGSVRDGLVLLQTKAMAERRKTGRGGSAASGAHPLKLFLAGDVMTGRGIDQVLPHPGDPALREAFVRDAREYVRLAERHSGTIPAPVDHAYIWGDALEVWRREAPELRIVNLETSVTTSDDFWSTKGIHYRMHPANVACLTAARIDCCVLANNHVLDFGHAGLEETLSTLRESGLTPVGAGADREGAIRPARFALPGKGHVLVFAMADGSSGVPDEWRAQEQGAGIHLLDDLSSGSADRVVATIRAERQAEDVAIASIHWGGNWGDHVPSEQRRFAHRLIDSGAVDIVHGHSAHHAKAIEFHRGKLILYGCGDFVTDYEGIGGHERFRPWLSLMFFVRFAAGSRRIERLEIVPLRMQRLQLVLAADGDRRWLASRLNEVSAPYGTRLETQRDRLTAIAPLVKETR